MRIGRARAAGAHLHRRVRPLGRPAAVRGHRPPAARARCRGRHRPARHRGLRARIAPAHGLHPAPLGGPAHPHRGGRPRGPSAGGVAGDRCHGRRRASSPSSMSRSSTYRSPKQAESGLSRPEQVRVAVAPCVSAPIEHHRSAIRVSKGARDQMLRRTFAIVLSLAVVSVALSSTVAAQPSSRIGQSFDRGPPLRHLVGAAGLAWTDGRQRRLHAWHTSRRRGARRDPDGTR